jgi:hypothetical protein
MHRAVLTLILMTSLSLKAQTPPDWVDPSPHEKRWIDVGTDRTLVLLSQLGQTAHIYDDWAPGLANAFHVLAWNHPTRLWRI